VVERWESGRKGGEMGRWKGGSAEESEKVERWYSGAGGEEIKVGQ
jgi:hypothetical protein